MGKNLEVTTDLLREAVQISIESAALAEKVAADQSAVESKVPLVVNAMIDSGLVDVLDKQATVDLLTNHGSALDVVARLASMASTPRRMGSGEKAAFESFDPQNPPKKESDRVFEEKLMSTF